MIMQYALVGIVVVFYVLGLAVAIYEELDFK